MGPIRTERTEQFRRQSHAFAFQVLQRQGNGMAGVEVTVLLLIYERILTPTLLKGSISFPVWSPWLDLIAASPPLPRFAPGFLVRSAGKGHHDRLISKVASTTVAAPASTASRFQAPGKKRGANVTRAKPVKRT